VNGITLTHEQLVAWAGRPLSARQIAELDNIVPNSGIPEAIAEIVHAEFGPGLGWEEASCGEVIAESRIVLPGSACPLWMMHPSSGGWVVHLLSDDGMYTGLDFGARYFERDEDARASAQSYEDEHAPPR